ncbi:hypothetical protein J3R83DRAFT_4204 [Lanmaoa asiatica]|nr:hypothetical protein J3R83DRAFT_4204 [Lanmaoa asiatica]
MSTRDAIREFLQNEFILEVPLKYDEVYQFTFTPDFPGPLTSLACWSSCSLLKRPGTPLDAETMVLNMELVPITDSAHVPQAGVTKDRVVVDKVVFAQNEQKCLLLQTRQWYLKSQIWRSGARSLVPKIPIPPGRLLTPTKMLPHSQSRTGCTVGDLADDSTSTWDFNPNPVDPTTIENGGINTIPMNGVGRDDTGYHHLLWHLAAAAKVDMPELPAPAIELPTPATSEPRPVKLDKDQEAKKQKTKARMRVPSERTGRNLCARRWLKQVNKDGTKSDFEEYWWTLTKEQRAVHHSKYSFPSPLTDKQL